MAVTATFAIGLVRGDLPGTRPFPTTVDPWGRYLDGETVREVVEIGLPVVGRNSVWTVAKFPTFAIVALFGPSVVATDSVTPRTDSGDPEWTL
ncbi:MAG: hypothetical protein ABEH66_05655, partial [Halobacteriales archaeon]